LPTLSGIGGFFKMQALLTEEQNPNSMRIDQLSTLEMLRVMNEEDKKVAFLVEQALPQMARAVEAIVPHLRQGGRLIYAGAGTSGRLALLDAAECVPTFSTPPEMVQALLAGGEKAFVRAVEGAEDRVEDGRRDLVALHPTPHDVVVGIAASGTTPYVIGVLDCAQERGLLTVGIACNHPAPILERVQFPIAVVTGAEVITGSTRLKAGTAQKLILNMLSTTIMIQLGKVYGNLMVDVQVTNQKLAARAQRIVAQISGISLEKAAQILEETDHEVKTAIVVAVLHISPTAARQKLAQHAGMLRQVIGDR
jgi:N-acetylmuramic acid 6-phosphate etherase